MVGGHAYSGWRLSASGRALVSAIEGQTRAFLLLHATRRSTEDQPGNAPIRQGE
jgi:hypothetical protein